MEHKDKLPPIPTPASQRWREFRIQILPFIIFIAVVAGIVSLWRGFVNPVGIVGFAETNAVNVVATQDGLLSVLNVERFQMVTQDQEIGLIVNTDPEFLKAQITSAQADLKVLAERNEVDVQRTDQSYQQFRQQLFSHQVDQAKDAPSWQLASNEFVRASAGLKTGVETPATFDAKKYAFETLTATIASRDVQIAELKRTLSELEARRRGTNGAPSAFAEAYEAKARELELMLKPSTVRAPISGMISFVHHSGGERVLRGMPIVTITAPVARHVIGYIRQPIATKPEPNATVQITTRSQPRTIARGQVVHVGAQLEPINPALLSVDTKRMEVGLPILVSVPQGVRLTPGEFVDLFIETPKK